MRILWTALLLGTLVACGGGETADEGADKEAKAKKGDKASKSKDSKGGKGKKKKL